jgi:cytochrome c-type biogenesis protein CcmH/NrfF
MKTLCLTLCTVAALVLAPSSSVAAATPKPRASLTTIERQVMCVTCKIPLNVAESPQANRERAFIRGLIAQGQSESQIKEALVGQYGPTALALPSSKGFDLAAYLVPLAVVVGLLILLITLLPSWRRHALAVAGRTPEVPSLDPSDAARLDADLKSFD